MHNETLDNLQEYLNKLLQTSDPSKIEETTIQYNGFTKLFTRFLQDRASLINWDRLEKLPEDAVKDYNGLEEPNMCMAHQMLRKLVIVKLNGGLGTSMGCSYAKSIILVKETRTFLDLTVEQIDHLNETYNVNVPLVLMNSFNTEKETDNILKQLENYKVQIHTFNQSCYPRIHKETLMPVATEGNILNDKDNWYPPGHGDFYESFKNSGLLEKFIKEGKIYCYVSNIDNLGATVDLKILNCLLNPKEQPSPHEFIMEVTDKTRADIKGGTLIQYEEKVGLLELAQVPDDHVHDFKSVKVFKHFNTNNIWVKLEAIDRVVKQDLLQLEIIVNNKSLKDGTKVIQLETAVGAGMKYFENSVGINVPRSRFLPVKKTSDLLLVMSDLYVLDHGALVMSPFRMFPTIPLVTLGDQHFKTVKEFLTRFSSIPDILELDSLTVSGDVTFGKGTSLRGTVIIIANGADKIDIPAGAILENKIVSGNLVLLEH